MQWLDWNTSESGIGPTTPADQYPPYIRAHLWNIYRVCVCVESPESKGISRRPGTHDCLSWPTKTGQRGGENVPANF